MASLIIRNLDEPLKAKLRIRAAHNGQSMEEEVRQILRTVLGPPPGNFAEAIRRRFSDLGGVELPDVPRGPMRELPRFD